MIIMGPPGMLLKKTTQGQENLLVVFLEEALASATGSGCLP